MPGAANVYPEPLTSGQYLNITIDRQSAARYGISVAAIQETIEYAIGETPAGILIDGRRRFPVRVRFAERFRASPDAIGDTPVMSPTGQHIPLRSITKIESARGPAMISSENGLLLSQVLLNVQGRDVGSFVSEAKRVLADRLALPSGYYLGWSGRYGSGTRAGEVARRDSCRSARRLFVLWITYRSAAEAAHVLLAVPFALTGGFYLHRVAGFQLLGRRVGRVHRALRHRRPDRRRDGDLPRGRRGPANGARRDADASALGEAVIEGAVLRLRPSS